MSYDSCVITGGIVRNRAWILERHLGAVKANKSYEYYYLTNDNNDNTEEILRNNQCVVDVHNTGEAGWTRDGKEGPRYSSKNMAFLRNMWLLNAVTRWPQLTHLWVIDSDILPESWTLHRLLSHNVPIVGAWVPGCTPCAGWDERSGQARRTGKEGADGNLFHATMLGGCYLIRIDAISAGIQWREHAQGEDGGFGDSARELGLTLWADPVAKCTHVMHKPAETAINP